MDGNSLLYPADSSAPRQPGDPKLNRGILVTNESWVVVSMFFFPRILGEMIQFDSYLFQVGWKHLVAKKWFVQKKYLWWKTWGRFPIQVLIKDFLGFVLKGRSIVYIYMRWQAIWVRVNNSILFEEGIEYEAVNYGSTFRADEEQYCRRKSRWNRRR